ncbi:MAG: 16S rRNA (guanine(527)-N(7))-methyltransferase RsmG [Myxococcales bacterium]|nr:MAG: 16S rRNA (guanine(527)-N(7))-methyltransferase RsmG [Myxococcales bacterium]
MRLVFRGPAAGVAARGAAVGEPLRKRQEFLDADQTIVYTTPVEKRRMESMAARQGRQTSCSTWNSPPEAETFLAALASAFGAAGQSLPPGDGEAMGRAYAELCRWNRRLNLTRLIAPEEAAVGHFLDSAMAAPDLPPAAAVLDVGSGAGFPGVVLAIRRPDARVTLLEKTAKKVEFLRQLIRGVPLINAEAVAGSWPAWPADDAYDVIVSRATFADGAAWRDVGRALKADGTLWLWRGEDGALDIPGFVATSRPYRLPGRRRERRLVVYRRT